MESNEYAPHGATEVVRPRAAAAHFVDLARSAFSLFAIKSALLGTRVLTLLAIAAIGTTEDLAKISYAVAIAELLRTLGDWGLDTWLVRATALAPDAQARARAVAKAVRIKVVTTCLTGGAAVAICAAKFGMDAGIAAGALSCALLISSQVTGVAIAYHQGIGALRQLLRLLPACIAAIAAVAATLAITGDPLSAFTALAAGELIVAGIAVVMLRTAGALRRSPPAIANDTWSTLNQCLPLAALGIIVGVHSRIDTVFLAQISAAALASYTVAHRLFLPFQVAVGAIGGAIFGASASAISDGSFSTRRLYREIAATALTSIGMSLSLWIAATLVVKSLLPAYASSLDVVAVLCVVLVVNGVNTAMTSHLLAYGKFVVVAAIAATDLLCMVAALRVLLPSAGAVGAAQALLISSSVNMAAMAFALIRVHKRRTTPTHP